MIRIARRLVGVLFAVVVVGAAALAPAAATLAADDPCADLVAQLAATDRQLDQARNDTLPWLVQASQSALVVPSELAAAAQQGTPDLSPQLAETEAALVAQIGIEMQLASSSAYADSSAAFVTQLGPRLKDWEVRLALLLPLAPYSSGLQVLGTALQSLDRVAAPAIGTLALRDDLNNQLAACRQQAPPQTVGAAGCSLEYVGLDRSAGQTRLRPAVAGLSSDVAPGQQWDHQMTADTPSREGSTDVISSVTTVDTYACTPDGATKVGRTAVQSNPDGSTIAWGERDYVGTLWPKTIAPGAQWQWHAIQYSKDPDGVQSDYEEQWDVTVKDVGREQLTLPEGRFEAIHLQLDEDVHQPGDQLQHFTWDEWYARPLPAAGELPRAGASL